MKENWIERAHKEWSKCTLGPFPGSGTPLSGPGELPVADHVPGQWVYQDGKIPDAGGTKYDSGKPPISLIDPEFLEGLANVLGFGANKYAAHNWRNGIAYSRLISAAYRHLGAINKGEDNDAESNLPHVYHLACCVMFLAAMMKHRPDLDDRWKGNK